MDYVAELRKAISIWKTQPVENEWLFEEFRQNTVEAMNAAEAFDAIDATVYILLQEPDEDASLEILQTLIYLASKSDTTEVPKRLLVSISAITAKFATYGDYEKNKLAELLKHYRLLLY